MDSVAARPRTHLGDVVYDPILKPSRLQDPRTGRPPRSGYSSTPRPLPWGMIEGKENCTLTVKIGKEHLTPAAREEITFRRAVWGTDIYTDDSDVIAACIHAGWIRGEWPEDVDIDQLGLDEGPNGMTTEEPKGRRGAAKNGHQAAPQQTSTITLTEPPKTGPMPVPENKDLHVTLLVLPRLQKYTSTTRFGIKSREFGGSMKDSEGVYECAPHDGISFMIMKIHWLTNGAAPQNRLRGKARRERIRKALREIELGPAWPGAARNNGETLAVKATVAPVEKPAEIAGTWWKQSSKSKSPNSEGDKENQHIAGQEEIGKNKEQTEQGNEGGQGEEQEKEADVEPTGEQGQEAQENGHPENAPDVDIVDAPPLEDRVDEEKEKAGDETKDEPATKREDTAMDISRDDEKAKEGAESTAREQSPTTEAPAADPAAQSATTPEA